MTEFILHLNDFTENITLNIIDHILMVEKIGLEKFKFDDLYGYIIGVDRLYSDIIRTGSTLSEEYKIPLIESIKTIIYEYQNNKIDSKEAWIQIKDLIQRASEFTKYYKESLKIDINELKEFITLKVIEAFNHIDSSYADKFYKYVYFDNIYDGIEDVYISILESLNIEIDREQIPLLEIIDDIGNAYAEDRISSEEIWDQIKDVINTLSE